MTPGMRRRIARRTASDRASARRLRALRSPRIRRPAEISESSEPTARHCERSEAIHVGPRCCGANYGCDVGAVCVKVKSKHLGGLDCFASLAMTAENLTPLFLRFASVRTPACAPPGTTGSRDRRPQRPRRHGSKRGSPRPPVRAPARSPSSPRVHIWRSSRDSRATCRRPRRRMAGSGVGRAQRRGAVRREITSGRRLEPARDSGKRSRRVAQIFDHAEADRPS